MYTAAAAVKRLGASALTAGLRCGLAPRHPRHGFALAATRGVGKLPAALQKDIQEFAGRSPTPLMLQEILAMKEPRAAARMLMDELPVRLANRIFHVETLSYLDEIEQMLAVRADFIRSFSAVRKAAKEDMSPEDFCRVIKDLKSRHSMMVHSVSLGMQEWRDLNVSNKTMTHSEARVFVDDFLDRLFLSRIGMETLTSQYLSIFQEDHKGLSVVDPACDPCEVIRAAANKVQDLAITHFMNPPKVEIYFHGPETERTAPLIPAYLFYIVSELLKNSMRAVGDQHERLYGDEGTPEPIRVRVSSDAAQIGVQIFDRGGGIPFNRQPHIWSYNYTTANGSEVCDASGNVLKGPKSPSALAGFGVGLPLSRLYAEYIGGTLHVMSMPNFGTHAYVFLQRCDPGERREGLPTWVNWQKKRRLKERIEELNTKKKYAVELEEYFEAGRLKAQIAELKAELSVLK